MEMKQNEMITRVEQDPNPNWSTTGVATNQILIACDPSTRSH